MFLGLVGLFPAWAVGLVAYLFVALALCYLAVLVLLLGERFEPDTVPVSVEVVAAQRAAATRAAGVAANEDVTLPEITLDLPHVA